MAVFAKVVEAGSMSRAARALDMTTSAVSQQIRLLELDARVTLLRRSTRRLTLTEAGEAFYAGCAAMVSAASAANHRLGELRDAPVGELSISAPVGFAAHHLTEALTPLLIAHRQLSLRLVITDEAVDIIETRIDLAIKTGPLVSSSLRVRHLANWEFLLCASPAYLARRGAPTSPEELTTHDWLVLASHDPNAIQLIDATGQRLGIPAKGRVTSNNQLSLKLLALAGFGISPQVLPEVIDELADTRLVRVLPEWSLILPVYIVTSDREKQPAKVRYAAEALRTYLNDPRRWRRTQVAQS